MVGRSIISGAAAGLALACAAVPADAGGFNPRAGEIYLSVSGSFTDSGLFYDARGRVVTAANWRRFELTAYAEYGLTDWLALIAKPGFVTTQLSAPLASDYSGLGDSEWAAQIQVFRRGAMAVAVRGGLHVPAAGLEARVLVARGFELSGRRGYGDAQLAYRLRAGDRADEVHLDLTLGFRVRPAIELRMQSFNMFGLDDPRGGGQVRRHKLLAGIFYEFANGWLAGWSGFSTVAGRSTVHESGFQLSAERRF